MQIIAELAFHLILNVLMYSVGRLAIIALSFGRIRPRPWRETWHGRTDRDRAMGLYYESVAVSLVGMAVLAAILFLYVFLQSP